MKNEADFKAKFKKSVKYHRGFALSLAAPMLVGIPDMYVALPEYLPILLEAKWLGEIKRDKFKRKIPFTAMQMHWLTECDNVLPYSAMGLIGFEYKEQIYAVLVKPGTPYFYELTDGFLVNCANVVCKRKETNIDYSQFDVTDLFKQVPIPRIARKTSDLGIVIKHSDINPNPPALDGGA